MGETEHCIQLSCFFSLKENTQCRAGYVTQHQEASGKNEAADTKCLLLLDREMFGDVKAASLVKLVCS
jgi:hypothetical protein